MPRSKHAGSRNSPVVRVLEPNAAGIDIGAAEIYVAVPSDRDSQPVRRFSTFTDDLIALAEWLKACGIDSVAMESTSVYWAPVSAVGKSRVKSVPGECQACEECTGA